jgi:hypothetical protein
VIDLGILSTIVAAADEIRKNIAARGEEAQKQFEKAIERNKKSFAEMVRDAGGELPDDEPTPTPPPPTPTPPPTPSGIYERVLEYAPMFQSLQPKDEIFNRLKMGGQGLEYWIRAAGTRSLIPPGFNFVGYAEEQGGGG